MRLKERSKEFLVPEQSANSIDTHVTCIPMHIDYDLWHV